MRLPFLRPKPKADSEAARPAARRAGSPRAGATEADGDVAAARARARRRLVGALVLLVIGVIGFPVLFETQPRPLPLDIPIELPAGEGRSATPAAPAQAGRALPSLSLPADGGSEGAVAEPAAPVAASPAPGPARPASTASPVVAVIDPRMAPAAPAATVKDAVPVPPATPAATPAAVVAVPTAPKPSAEKMAAPSAVPSPRAATPTPPNGEGARAAALLAGATPASASATASGRFVVQVGAFSDAATLRATRAKVEKLDLKTYTQVIEGDAGKRTRVRVGPFISRAEADAAAAKLKRAGLPANVLAL